MIIHPITGNRFNLYSSRGRNLLKYYISHYKHGGTKRAREEEEDETCIICFSELNVPCDVGCLDDETVPDTLSTVILNCGHKFHYCCFKKYFITVQDTTERYGSQPSYWYGIDLATPTCPYCRSLITSVKSTKKLRKTLTDYSSPNLLIGTEFDIVTSGGQTVFIYKDRDNWESGTSILTERYKKIIQKMLNIQGNKFLQTNSLLDVGEGGGIPFEITTIYNKERPLLINRLGIVVEKNNRTSELYNYLLSEIFFYSDWNYDRVITNIEAFTTNDTIRSLIYLDIEFEQFYDAKKSANPLFRYLVNIFNWSPTTFDRFSLIGSIILISILTDYCNISIVKKLIDVSDTIGGFKKIFIDNSFARLPPVNNNIFPGITSIDDFLQGWERFRTGELNMSAPSSISSSPPNNIPIGETKIVNLLKRIYSNKTEDDDSYYFDLTYPIIDLIIKKILILKSAMLSDTSSLPTDEAKALSEIYESDINTNALQLIINNLRQRPQFSNSEVPRIEYIDKANVDEYITRLIEILKYIVNKLRTKYPDYFDILIDTQVVYTGEDLFQFLEAYPTQFEEIIKDILNRG